ncbi:MAG TPA: ABC transporter substrate-binding protein [bacterium]|nr:ABC transporter substrate-binding protein [bacterium]
MIKHLQPVAWSLLRTTVVLIVFFGLLFPKMVFADQPTTYRIALVHTFSKADPNCYDPYGKNLENGVRLAWEVFKRTHHGLSFEIEFKQYDLADNPLLAAPRVMEAAQDSSVIAAIGLGCSDLALLGGVEAQHQGLPILTPGATDDRVSNIGDNVFMILFSNSYQGEVLAQFAFHELKKKDVLVIKAVDCTYCLSLADAFKVSFEKQGGHVVADLNVLKTDQDFKDLVRESKKYKFDVVLLANYAMQVAGIIGELVKEGTDIPFLGGDSWLFTKESFEAAGDIPFVGYSSTVWVPDYPTPNSKKFVLEYSKKFKEPLLDTAAYSYDAAMLIFNALQKTATPTRENLRQALLATGSYEGVSGTMNYGGKTVPKRGALIMKTTNHKQQIYKVFESN